MLDAVLSYAMRIVHVEMVYDPETVLTIRLIG